jgi:hypothetical protein
MSNTDRVVVFSNEMEPSPHSPEKLNAPTSGWNMTPTIDEREYTFGRKGMAD